MPSPLNLKYEPQHTVMQEEWLYTYLQSWSLTTQIHALTSFNEIS